MSWSRGSVLFGRIAEVIEHIVSNEDDRREIYLQMIEAFEEFDCDTIHECTDIDHILDEVIESFYEPDNDDEDDDWPDGGREDFS